MLNYVASMGGPKTAVNEKGAQSHPRDHSGKQMGASRLYNLRTDSSNADAAFYSSKASSRADCLAAIDGGDSDPAGQRRGSRD
jgi:hypothetical protein